MANPAVNGVPSSNGAGPSIDWSTVPPVPPSPLLSLEEGDRTAHKRELHTVNVGAVLSVRVSLVTRCDDQQLCSLSARARVPCLRFVLLCKGRVSWGGLDIFKGYHKSRT